MKSAESHCQEGHQSKNADRPAPTTELSLPPLFALDLLIGTNRAQTCKVVGRQVGRPEDDKSEDGPEHDFDHSEVLGEEETNKSVEVKDHDSVLHVDGDFDCQHDGEIEKVEDELKEPAYGRLVQLSGETQTEGYYRADQDETQVGEEETARVPRFQHYYPPII